MNAKAWVMVASKPSARGIFARTLDAVAILLILFAAFEFGVAPRLGLQRSATVPVATIQTIEGRRVAMTASGTKPVLLDFWASWCGPCKESIPLVQSYARSHPGVDVVSVDVGESLETVRSYLRSHPMRAVALDPDQHFASAFGVTSYPTMILISGGTERAKWVGYNPALATLVDAKLEHKGG